MVAVIGWDDEARGGVGEMGWVIGSGDWAKAGDLELGR